VLELPTTRAMLATAWLLLTSAASTHALQQSILPDSIDSLEDPSVASNESKWSSLARPTQQLIAGDERHIQTEWDKKA